MGKLPVYLSHSARDNAFCQRLAWALRGAGADVWFDRHVSDESMPAYATVEEMTKRSVFVLAVSRAALASKWAQTEFKLFVRHYTESVDRLTGFIERQRKHDQELAAFYYEVRKYSHRHIIPVLVDQLDDADFTGDWQSLIQFIGQPSLLPYPETEAIERTIHAVADLLPTGELRTKLAELAHADYARLPEAFRPTATIEELLDRWPAPLRTDGDLETLIERGKASSDDAGEEVTGLDSPAVWCVVANIAREQRFGPSGNESRRGTKHFAPGAKVYCLPAHWGDGYEDIMVIGRHRATHRYVKMVLPAKRLTNWRVDLVYSPHVIAELQGDWDGTRASKTDAERLTAMCVEREIKRNGEGG